MAAGPARFPREHDHVYDGLGRSDDGYACSSASVQSGPFTLPCDSRHAADPRATLSDFVDRHEEYFDPPNPRIDEIMGNGTYSSYRGDIDAQIRSTGLPDQLAIPGIRVPVHGNVYAAGKNAEEEWNTDQSTTMSLSEMEEGVRRTRQQGFHLLNYFNVFEFGRDCKQTYPPPPLTAAKAEDYWKYPNDLAWHVFSDSLIYYEPESFTARGNRAWQLIPANPATATIWSNRPGVTWRTFRNRTASASTASTSPRCSMNGATMG